MAEIKILSSKVACACQVGLNDMESKILAKREQLIQYELTRKWFKADNREDAILRLKHSNDWAWYKAEWPYIDKMAHIDKILKACQVAHIDGQITLNEEDVHALKDYL